MERKVRICTLCASTVQDAANHLEQRASAFTSDVAVNDYESASAFAAGVDSCALDGGVILAAAPLSEFLNAKLRLIRTVSQKIVRSNSVNNALADNSSLEQKEKDLHCAIPEKSKVLRTEDGLFSAFIKEHGKALVVFLPLDAERIDYLFSAGLAKFIGAIFPEAKLPETQPSPKSSGAAALRESVETVIRNGKTVAISPCGCAKPLISAISAVPGCEQVFVQDNSLRDRLPDESAENYIAQCAKLSKENSGTDLGISVSTIYKDKTDESDFVIVCVADSDRAKAAKVFANPGEDHKHLVAAALIRLCGMLGELSGPAGLVNPDAPSAKPKKWAKNSKLPIVITAIGIAIAVVIGLIIAFALGGNNKNETVVPENGNYDFIQQDSYYADMDYHGNGNADYFDMQAAALQNETTALYTEVSSTSTTVQQTSVSQTVTKIVTTIKNVVTTKKPTTTKALTTTAKATTTLAPTTLKPTTTKATTTLKPTTTAKPTTTLAPTTTAVSGGAVESTTSSSSQKGVFVFKVYGHGHGVGMSQHGAMAMANNGDTYEKILTHYYPGTTVKADSSTPATIKYGGADIPIVEYLCKTTKQEMGYSNAGKEALKAQMATIYTFAKHNDFNVAKSKHAYAETFEYEGTKIYEACLEYLGMSAATDTPVAKYVDYNGTAANAVYFSSSAGKTASAASVWGADKYPYLNGGVSSRETVDVSTKEITAEEMKKLIEAYAKENDITITLSDNPAEWIEVVSHDAAVNANTGYATTVRIGDKEVRGNTFRCYVLDFKIRSHCFTFEYIPA